LIIVIIIGSSILGLATAETNQWVFPHEPIDLEISTDAAKSLPLVQTLKITSLSTVAVNKTQQFLYDFTPQKEFRQGDIMGILLNYTYTHKNLQNAEIWKAVVEREDEYVYLGETLIAYFKISITLYNSQGNLVANTSDMQSLSGGGTSSSGLYNATNISMYKGYYMFVPYSWTTETYTIKVSIKELLTGLSDTSETTVNITVGLPPEVPHPISVHPRQMIIGSEDLPEGWVVAVQDLNLTTLEGYATSVGFYIKSAGDFKKEVQLQIIQFSNIEVATQYLESSLEGAVLTEKHGYGKVTMQQLGDSGFLVDRFERRSPSWNGWDDSSYASGSGVTFRKDNLVFIFIGFYEFEAIKQDVYVTNDELIELAEIQAAKISAITGVSG
jgi:hypothetical protein